MSPNQPFIARLQTSLRETLSALVGDARLPPTVRAVEVRSMNSLPPCITMVHADHQDASFERVFLEFDERPSVSQKSTRIDFRLAFLPVGKMLSDGIQWQHHSFAMNTHCPEIAGMGIAQAVMEFLNGEEPSYEHMLKKLERAQ